MKKTTLLVLGLLTFFAAGISLADDEISRLIDLPLEALTRIEIFSAGRKDQKVQDIASSVYVLTTDDIKRSGATNIPDLLRLVPGLQVASINSHQWAISSRGFNSLYSDELLVMIDGMTIYHPVFSGVYWDEWDLMLDDIERIEVVRGPGSSMWGANAVNGVINIITKTTTDIRHDLVAVGAGSHVQGLAEGRMKDRFADGKGGYALSLKHSVLDGSASESGSELFDSWNRTSSRFRADYDLNDKNTFFVEAGLTRGSRGFNYIVPSFSEPYIESVSDRGSLTNWNVHTRYTHRHDDGEEFSIQAYFLQSRIDEVEYFLENRTADLDFQYRVKLFPQHEVVWGVGFRTNIDHTRGTENVHLTDASKDFNLYSFFVQDEFETGIEGLKLTFGSKFEAHQLGGFFALPSARFSYASSESSTIWGAVSRAVRSPSRIDHSLSLIGGVFPDETGTLNVVKLLGDSSFDYETTLFYELGWRGATTDWSLLDIGIFFADYDDLATYSYDSPMLSAIGGQEYLVLPRTIKASENANSFGAEVVQDFECQPWWRLQLGYAAVFVDFSEDQTPPISEDPDDNAGAPQHQVLLRSNWDLSDNWQLDGMYRFVDRVVLVEGGTVPSYSTISLRLAYQPSKNWEVVFTGENLLDRQHPEFVTNFPKQPQSFIKRAAFARLVWRF